jgi:hypothetical protein
LKGLLDLKGVSATTLAAFSEKTLVSFTPGWNCYHSHGRIVRDAAKEVAEMHFHCAKAAAYATHGVNLAKVVVAVIKLDG